jgi:hypothetical protein
MRVAEQVECDGIVSCVIHVTIKSVAAPIYHYDLTLGQRAFHQARRVTARPGHKAQRRRGTLGRRHVVAPTVGDGTCRRVHKEAEIKRPEGGTTHIL